MDTVVVKWNQARWETFLLTEGSTKVAAFLAEVSVFNNTPLATSTGLILSVVDSPGEISDLEIKFEPPTLTTATDFNVAMRGDWGTEVQKLIRKNLK